MDTIAILMNSYIIQLVACFVSECGVFPEIRDVISAFVPRDVVVHNQVLLNFVSPHHRVSTPI